MKRTLALILLACIGYHTQGGAETPPMNRDTSAGKRIFDRSCGACHAPGTRNPGTASLAAKYGKEKPAALEQREDLTPDLVSYFVRHGVSIMPPFRKTEITDEELQDLGAYLGRDRAK